MGSKPTTFNPRPNILVLCRDIHYSVGNTTQDKRYASSSLMSTSIISSWMIVSSLLTVLWFT